MQRWLDLKRLTGSAERQPTGGRAALKRRTYARNFLVIVEAGLDVVLRDGEDGRANEQDGLLLNELLSPPTTLGATRGQNFTTAASSKSPDVSWTDEDGGETALGLQDQRRLAKASVVLPWRRGGLLSPSWRPTRSIQLVQRPLVGAVIIIMD